LLVKAKENFLHLQYHSHKTQAITNIPDEK